jgi:hypothetical protein
VREKIITNLASSIDRSIVLDLVESYEQLLVEHRSGDLEAALTKGGRFVEHTLRIIEFVLTKTIPAEIKSVKKSVQRLENETTLPESLRLLIPRAVYGMIYNLRSKRDAVHVKEIDPTPIDVSLAVAAASWVMAELLRLYHVSDDKVVAQAMAALSRTNIPFVEVVNGETFVGQKVPAAIEILLLLAHVNPDGITRKAIGNAAKCSQPSVTNSLKALMNDRFVHLSANKEHFITTTGEQYLADWLARSS